MKAGSCSSYRFLIKADSFVVFSFLFCKPASRIIERRYRNIFFFIMLPDEQFATVVDMFHFRCIITKSFILGQIAPYIRQVGIVAGSMIFLNDLFLVITSIAQVRQLEIQAAKFPV